MATSLDRKDIAIVGSGLTGLAAAWILGEHHNVTLFERAPALGMGAYGVPIPMADGSVANIDVPLRVLSTSYYHFLFELYNEAGIPVKAEDYSLSFSHAPSSDKQPQKLGTTYWLNTLLRVAGYSTPIPRMSSVEALSATGAFARLLHLCRRDGHDASLSKVTFGQWLDSNSVPKWERDHIILPLLSIILTCDHSEILEYPAGIVVDYMGAGQGESVRRAVGGSSTVCDRLSRRADVRLNARIASVSPAGASHKARVSMEDGTEMEFDSVVLATQANIAAKLLGGHKSKARLVDALQSFGYCKTHSVCHTDRTVMPADRADWRVVNFGIAPSAERSMATIYMNALLPDMRMPPNQAAKIAQEFRASQSSGQLDWDDEDGESPGEKSAQRAAVNAFQPTASDGSTPDYVSRRADGTVDVFQTLNPLVQPHPDSVISECWADRPIMSLASLDAFETIAQAQGQGSVYICGSYSVYGMPLLEGAVESAVSVCRQLGVETKFFHKAAAQRRQRHEVPEVELPLLGKMRCTLCLPNLVFFLLFVVVATVAVLVMLARVL